MESPQVPSTLALGISNNYLQLPENSVEYAFPVTTPEIIKKTSEKIASVASATSESIKEVVNKGFSLFGFSISKKYLYIFIGIIAAIVVFYFIYKWFFSGSKQTNDESYDYDYDEYYEEEEKVPKKPTRTEKPKPEIFKKESPVEEKEIVEQVPVSDEDIPIYGE